jgi:Amt family ammonium transporter
MTGAFANRFRFKPYVIFITLWMIVVYAPFCHWVWGGGWMAEWGVFDFAGGIVVHITAGFSALASLLVVGRREAAPGEVLDEPHNIPFVALGTALLWFGWFGFNGGSALGSTGTAVVAAVNSEVAASVALLTWLLIDWVRFGRPKLVGLCIGAIAGLATVTPAAGFIQPWGAGVLGVLAAILCYVCCEVRRSLAIDDALDVWGVHGMGGFIGTVLLGVLADPPACAPEDGTTAPTWCVNPGTVVSTHEQLGKQFAAAVFCAAYSMVVTFVMLHAINLVIPILPEKGENLDLAETGEIAYSPQKAYIPSQGDSESSPKKAFRIDEVKEVTV